MGKWVGHKPEVVALKQLAGDELCDMCGGYNIGKHPMYLSVGAMPDGSFRNGRAYTLLCYDCELSWTRYANRAVVRPSPVWTSWCERRKKELDDNQRKASARRRRNVRIQNRATAQSVRGRRPRR